jgi:hypothetical protein
MIKTVFSNRLFVGLVQSDVSFMFFDAELDGPSALVILHSPAHEDGTDKGFRNVGF